MAMIAEISIEDQHGDLLSDLPVSYYFTVPNNYLGYGGWKSTTATTNTNAEGQVSVTMPDLNSDETGGQNILYLTTQTVKSTSYTTTSDFSGFHEVFKTYKNTETFRSSKGTFALSPKYTNHTFTSTLTVTVNTTKTLYKTSTTTTSVPTSTGSTTTYINTTITSTNNQSSWLSSLEKDFSQFGSMAQTDIEIVGIIVALVVVAGILIYVIKLRSGK